MFSAVQVNLAGQVLLEEQGHYRPVLHDPKRQESGDAHDSRGQAERRGDVLEILLDALLGEFLGPGKGFRLSAIGDSQGMPYSRKIRLAVRRARRGSGGGRVRLIYGGE